MCVGWRAFMEPERVAENCPGPRYWGVWANCPLKKILEKNQPSTPHPRNKKVCVGSVSIVSVVPCSCAFGPLLRQSWLKCLVKKTTQVMVSRNRQEKRQSSRACPHGDLTPSDWLHLQKVPAHPSSAICCIRSFTTQPSRRDWVSRP